jgi:hypothetical protein
MDDALNEVEANLKATLDRAAQLENCVSALRSMPTDATLVSAARSEKK